MTNFKYQKELLMLLTELKIRKTDKEKYALAENEIKIALIEKRGDCGRVKMKLQSFFSSRS
ncbi:hypothetical protein D0469_13375 [Peribacillus saganii]|uniref:Uncharacterized protein n=1 Tax=Peribacillus saganii TaxID=2303992 RepID=A0A372LMM4_9BACI|nr:hypothetical protein [Peribacillus saganii]RFU67906.1 hypothetical protein D0469_13375 [Peribacillus saganii]